MRCRFFLSAVLALLLVSTASANDEASRLYFAQGFVQDLVDAHKAEGQARAEIAVAKKSANADKQVLMALIRSATRIRMRIQVSLNRLQNTRISEQQFSTLPDYFMAMYSRKSELFGEMVDAAKTMMSGPVAGVDYGKLAAHMPEITAQVEFVDESIFKATPLIALSLISSKPDSKGKLSHLLITRQQAGDMSLSLQRGFGPALQDKEPNWTTASAILLLSQLQRKGYRYLDDPWE